MNKIYTLLAASSLLAISSTAQAESGQIGLGIKAGTLGGGLELSMDINPYLELRAGINQVSFDFDTTIGDIDYDFAPDFLQVRCFLIYTPLAMLFALV